MKSKKNDIDFEDEFTYVDLLEPVNELNVISMKETSGADVPAVIFGFYDHFASSNFGNPQSTVITNLQTGTNAGYGQMLAQTQYKTFKIFKFRFQSTNSEQLKQTIQIVHIDSLGNCLFIPLNMNIEKNRYQQQHDIVDIDKVVTIGPNTSLNLTLKANTTLTISMFMMDLNFTKIPLFKGNSMNKSKNKTFKSKNIAPAVLVSAKRNRHGE